MTLPYWGVTPSTHSFSLQLHGELLGRLSADPEKQHKDPRSERTLL